MRPDYGCAIHRLIFAPNDETTAGLAIHYVREALDKWEPRIEVLNLDARRQDGAQDGPAAGSDLLAGNCLYIWLEYRVRATQQLDTLRFSLDLSGGVR